MNHLIVAAHKQVIALDHAQTKIMNLMLYGMKCGREGVPVDMSEAIKFHMDITRERNARLGLDKNLLDPDNYNRGDLQKIGLQESVIKEAQYKTIINAGKQLGEISAANAKGANKDASVLVTISSKLGKSFGSLVNGFSKGDSLADSVKRVVGESEVLRAEKFARSIEVDTKHKLSNVEGAMKDFLKRNNIDLNNANPKLDLPVPVSQQKQISQSR